MSPHHVLGLGTRLLVARTLVPSGFLVLTALLDAAGAAWTMTGRGSYLFDRRTLSKSPHHRLGAAISVSTVGFFSFGDVSARHERPRTRLELRLPRDQPGNQLVMTDQEAGLRMSAVGTVRR